MRRIGQEVTPISDDTSQLEQHAHWYHLTINEIVYHSNAREYGGDKGLEQIRNSDIIPLDVARRALKTIGRSLHLLRLRMKAQG